MRRALLLLLLSSPVLAQTRTEFQTCRESLTPETPAADRAFIYCQDNGTFVSLWFKDSTGTTHDLSAAGGGGAPTTAKYITAADDAGLSADVFPSADDMVAVSDSSSAATWRSLSAGLAARAQAYNGSTNTWSQADIASLAASTSANLRGVLSDEAGTGAALFSPVASADLNLTTTSCTNQFVTAISSGGVGTCTTDTLASAQHANQGTTTTLLHGNAAGNPSFGSVVSADMNITTTSCTNQFVSAISAGGVGTCTTDTLASAQHANQGTTTTVLHGNAAGNPSFGAVVSGDMNITTTSCTNQFVTAISAGGVGTCTTDTLASAQHANQGTTTTVLHGNAAGNPSFGAVSLTADVSGTLPLGSGGTNNSAAAVQGAVVFSNSTQHAYTAAGTIGQALYSAGTGTPTWGDAPKIIRLTSDYTNATTSMTNTALTWTSPASVSRSGFECTLMIHQSAATLGTQVDVNVATAPTTISYMWRWVTGLGTAPSTAGTEKFVATNTNATALGDTVGLTANSIAHLSGVIVHTSTSTAVTVRAKASSAGTTTIVSGSYCVYYVL